MDILFKFPKQANGGTVNRGITFKRNTFDMLEEISKKNNVSINMAVNILLEGAISLYKQEQAPPVEHSPEAVKPQNEAVLRHISVSPEAKRWSRKYPGCRVCGTDSKKHMGRGYCTTCYFSVFQKQRDNRDGIIQDAEIPAPIRDLQNEPGVPAKKVDEIRREMRKRNNIGLKNGEESYYCQNAKCSKKGKQLAIKSVKMREKMKFCSNKCAEQVFPEQKEEENLEDLL